MKTIVEFASPEDLRKIRETSQGAGKRQGSYNDSLLLPKYAARKLRFPVGKTMVRLVPSIKPSVYDWMIQVQALNYAAGRHTHPRTLGAGKSVFDHAFSWLKSSTPAVLFSRANRDGYRLLADPVSLFWAIVEENGMTVSRIFVGSAYDGSRGGVQGIGCQIDRLIKDLAGEANPLADPVDPEEGVMICVEKVHPAGAKYASYSVRLGTTPTPMSQLISRMAEEEVKALCPLEKTIRILSQDEEYERLETLGINSETISAIRSSVR